MKKNKKIRQLQLFSFCIIPLLLLLIFNYFPMAGFLIAFKDYKYNLGIMGSEWTGLRNFETLFRAGGKSSIFYNTVLLNGAILVAQTVVSIMIALALYGIHNKKAVRRYQAVLLLPGLVSWVAAGYLVHAFLSPTYGVFSHVQTALDLDIIYWYSEPGYWPYILTVSAVWKKAGIGSLIYYMILSGIPSDRLEAAKLEGAAGLQKLLHVILPALRPVATTILLFEAGGIFKSDFDMFYQLTRGVSVLNVSTEVLDTYIYDLMRMQGNMGVAAAIGLTQSVMGMVLVLVINWLMRRNDVERSLF